MKKYILIAILSLATFTAFSQQKSHLEKSIIGVQLGLWGADVYNELRIGKKATLRTEVRMNTTILGEESSPILKFIVYPGISLQPKYYFNINYRLKSGKNIKNNAADYFSFQMSYSTDILLVSVHSGNEYNFATFIPTYGLRRNFAKNFNFEFKIGFGYKVGFDTKNTIKTVGDIGFKIGYDF